MIGDPVLEEMAMELKNALLRAGADPANPPTGNMPSERAFAEYQRRGGSVYTNADLMAKSLVERVVAMS
jgi:hypothetical protein